ncbi:alpha/beta fold hydrolase [Uliginosibacterium sp. H1]|uniref:alpha/beta fold hydrolase n=1 Tax=Uliginosibacterium sp. H1 TaxID=3114757 RepID=UPI002E19E4D5|nr:alpha/beta hydrolase [Uliginosibacterium sp. H1]
MSNVTFILVPGAGGDPWYWHLLAPKLEARGHEVVPVALPAADDSAGLPEYTNAVLRVLGNRDPKYVVLVAQSMGGFTAPLVCESVPVRALVLVNAMIPKPGERPGEWFVSTGQTEAKREQNVRDGRSADAPFDPLAGFFHDVPRSVTDEALARGESKQSENVFASPCTFRAWPAIPIHVLVARDDRFFPAAFQQRVVRERLGIEAEQLPGGHLVALSQPDELAARLLSYVA